ncbi:hypothetical protein AN161_02045 [Lysinibacillus sp. FJAT-14222]|nr:hypothetical protein AN161_02045 [Lysinibacillus sp. FJAT-14222]
MKTNKKDVNKYIKKIVNNPLLLSYSKLGERVEVSKRVTSWIHGQALPPLALIEGQSDLSRDLFSTA